MGVFSSRFSVKSILNSLCCFLLIATLILVISVPKAMAEGDGGGGSDSGYTGPRGLSSGQANATGGCACGTTMSGGAANGIIAFAAAFGVYAIASSLLGGSESDANNEVDDITAAGEAAVAKLYTSTYDDGDDRTRTALNVDISDMAPEAVISFIRALDDKRSEFQVILPQEFIDSGETLDIAPLITEGFNVRVVTSLELRGSYSYDRLYVNQKRYEDVVAVVEMEQIGMDIYLNITEVRRSDVTSFIANQNQPDNIYQVISAVEYIADQGGSDNSDYIPRGYNATMVQAIELPPEDSFANLFYVEPDGSITDWTGYAISAFGMNGDSGSVTEQNVTQPPSPQSEPPRITHVYHVERLSSGGTSPKYYSDSFPVSRETAQIMCSSRQNRSIYTVCSWGDELFSGSTGQMVDDMLRRCSQSREAGPCWDYTQVSYMTGLYSILNERHPAQMNRLRELAGQ